MAAAARLFVVVVGTPATRRRDAQAQPEATATDHAAITAFLERAWAEARLHSEREHVTPYIWSHPDRFRLRLVPAPRPVPPGARLAHPPRPHRRHDIDALRVLAFGLLILYHVGMYYVSWDWHVKSPHAGTALEPFMLSSGPWR